MLWQIKGELDYNSVPTVYAIACERSIRLHVKGQSDCNI